MKVFLAGFAIGIALSWYAGIDFLERSAINAWCVLFSSWLGVAALAFYPSKR